MKKDKTLDDLKLYLTDHKDDFLINCTRQKKTHHKKRINKKWLKRYGLENYQRINSFLLFPIVNKTIDHLMVEKMETYFDDFINIKDINV